MSSIDQVGRTFPPTIRITNQGIDLTNISLRRRIRIPKLIRCSRLDLRQRVSTVVSKLGPWEVRHLHLRRQGVAAGQAYGKVLVSCDQVKAPDRRSPEATNVY